MPVSRRSAKLNIAIASEKAINKIFEENTFEENTNE